VKFAPFFTKIAQNVEKSQIKAQILEKMKSEE
jgi:hypothetical protein